MKIAVFHNFLDNIGGAERVTLTLARELEADIFTTNIDFSKIKKMGFQEISDKIKSIGKVPINAPFRHQFTLKKFKKLNLKNYDLYIIAGDWAISGAKNNKPNLWYVHSPIRELWDLYQYTKEEIVPWYGKPFFSLWVKYNRYLTKRYLKYINKIVCNSKNTKKRIKKYLNKEAKVINPPIETNKFYYKKNGDYWLSVNRLTQHKRIDIQTKTFKNLPKEKLIIVGSYEKSKHFKQYLNYIKNQKPKNIKILSWVDFDKLVKLYSCCKGFLTTSKDEDFGMNVVEAMSAGKPVIAPNEGGYKKTIINGITGELINNITPQKLAEAIKKVGEKPEKYKENCLKRAQTFSVENFIKKIKREIKLN